MKRPTRPPAPKTCPVCGEEIRTGQATRNTIYQIRSGIPTSDQAHYPRCWAKCHPQARHIPAQPALFSPGARQ